MRSTLRMAAQVAPLLQFGSGFPKVALALGWGSVLLRVGSWSVVPCLVPSSKVDPLGVEFPALVAAVLPEVVRTVALLAPR